MNETMNGWKVILKESRMSVTGHKNWNPLAVKYPVNEEVFPKIPEAKLFFFFDQLCANRFAGFIGGYEELLVVPCVATNPTRPTKRIASAWYCIDLFWNAGAKHVTTKGCPGGTWLADSITCLE